MTASAVESAGGILMPYTLLLVNRSGNRVVNGRRNIALIERVLPMWSKEECKLCPVGSEAIAAKGENWPRLSARY